MDRSFHSGLQNVGGQWVHVNTSRHADAIGPRGTAREEPHTARWRMTPKTHRMCLASIYYREGYGASEFRGNRAHRDPSGYV
eukprot:7894242-Pyramimonas_sp.AAC.1